MWTMDKYKSPNEKRFNLLIMKICFVWFRVGRFSRPGRFSQWLMIVYVIIYNLNINLLSVNYSNITVRSWNSSISSNKWRPIVRVSPLHFTFILCSFLIHSFPVTAYYQKIRPCSTSYWQWISLKLQYLFNLSRLGFIRKPGIIWK